MLRKLRVSNSFPVKHILVMFLILFLSFSINFFGVGDKGWYEKYQIGSDALVFNNLACLKSDQHTEWLIFREVTDLNNINPACKNDGQAYYSQIGLQGRIMNYGFNLFGLLGMSVAHYILLIKMIVPYISATTMLMFSFWVVKRFGLAEAYFVTVLIANSVWIVGFSKSLFWSMPLLFLPFILTLFLINKKNNYKQDLLLFIALTILMMIKFATGYEYTSVLIISTIAAVVTIGVLDNYKKQRILFLSAIALFSGIIAFSATIGIHVLLIDKNINDKGRSFGMIYERFTYRTTKVQDSKKVVYDGLGFTVPAASSIIGYYIPIDSYKVDTPLVQTELVSVANYSLLPIISYPITLKEPLQTYVSSFFFSVIIFISLSINTIKNIRKRGSVISKKLNNECALFMGAIIGLLGVLSWLVLARGHSYVHAHINGIIFYMPYGLLLYTLLAIKLVKYFKKIKMIYVNK